MAEGNPGVGTPFQQFLGLHWNILADGSGGVAVEMDIRDDLRAPTGMLEGGVISTLVDVAGASAIAMAAGMVATENLSISFVDPGRVGPVRATAVPLRIGRHEGLCEVKVVDLGRGERLMAIGIVTTRILESE